MKSVAFPRLALLLFGLVLALGLASCASPLQRRIASNPKLYDSLSAADRGLVNQGRIREGMTKEAVFLSWGRPDHVAAGTQKGVKTERWTYMGSQPVYGPSYGPGYGGWGWGRGWGRYGYGYGGAWDPYWGGYGGYGPNVAYLPYKAATVDFRGNVVTSYLNGPQ